jgi:hypothetical protein
MLFSWTFATELDAEIEPLASMGAEFAWEEQLPPNTSCRNVILRDAEGKVSAFAAREVRHRTDACATSAGRRRRAPLSWPSAPLDF